jgi:hypothetical protein
MKAALACLATFLFTCVPFVQAGNPICEITAHCYAMPARDLGEFMLKCNPAGQADRSKAEIEKWVSEKKATFMGTLSTKGESRTQLKADGKEFNLETESVVSEDGNTVDIISSVMFLDQQVASYVTSRKNQFAFAGNSTPEGVSPNSKLKVYLVYLHSKISK